MTIAENELKHLKLLDGISWYMERAFKNAHDVTICGIFLFVFYKTNSWFIGLIFLTLVFLKVFYLAALLFGDDYKDVMLEAKDHALKKGRRPLSYKECRVLFSLLSVVVLGVFVWVFMNTILILAQTTHE